MNLYYFGLTHHALDVHQQWPKNEQRGRAKQSFVRSGVSIPMGDGIRQRRIPRWVDRGVKQDSRHDGSPVLAINRERTKPKWFCGEARQKGRDGEGASKCANGLHLITTNPDNTFFCRKTYPWRKVCFMSTFLFRSILQDPSRQV